MALHFLPHPDNLPAGHPARLFVKVTPDMVMIQVAEVFDAPTQQLVGDVREAHIARARHVAMYLIRKHLGISYKRIGRRFGGRDHTTVMHGCRRIARELETDADLAEMVSLADPLGPGRPGA